MNCPKCGYGFSKVVDCREIPGGKRRRRECSGCGTRYNGIEIYEDQYKKIITALDKMKKAMEDIT